MILRNGIDSFISRNWIEFLISKFDFYFLKSWLFYIKKYRINCTTAPQGDVLFLIPYFLYKKSNSLYQMIDFLISKINSWYEKLILDMKKSMSWYEKTRLIFYKKKLNCFLIFRIRFSDIKNPIFWYLEFAFWYQDFFNNSLNCTGTTIPAGVGLSGFRTIGLSD